MGGVHDSLGCEMAVGLFVFPSVRSRFCRLIKIPSEVGKVT